MTPASIDEVLSSLAQLATMVVPGADTATISAVDAGGTVRRAASSAVGETVASFEDTLGEGPCVDAARAAATTVTGSLGGDPRWPRFGPRAGRLGLQSVLALPLARGMEIVGVLGLFGTVRDGFDGDPDPLSLSFAAAAAVAIANTQVVERSIRAAADLERALSSRATIDQAIGILMSRSGATEEQAFDRLRAMSQESDVKLAEIARRLVHQARTRARRRTGGSAPDPVIPDQRLLPEAGPDRDQRPDPNRDQRPDPNRDQRPTHR